MRTYELTKLAEKQVETLSVEIHEIFQAYCDGINDFVAGVGIFNEE